MRLLEITAEVEAAGYDWLIRSNKFKNEDGPDAPYFANIMIGTSIRPHSWKSYPAYGVTAEDALECAYELWAAAREKPQE